MTDLIILGTFHYSGDVFSESMQVELDTFTDLLAELHPTKIAVEIPRRYQETIDLIYKDFDRTAFDRKTVLGEMVLYHQDVTFTSENEVAQIGFRLADKLGHKTVYAVDEDIEIPDAYLECIAPCFNAGHYLSRYNSMITRASTLLERYKILNDEECINTDHNYLSINKINLGNYEGSAFVLSWYERNLKIYSNLQNICKENDRILLIIGSGHIKILSDLAQADENIQLVSPF
ncbi:MAG: hypothetical protein IJD82_07180 [Clostridia bacterium]|nr:hypothetical protein [Clostridia bacterium]